MKVDALDTDANSNHDNVTRRKSAEFATSQSTQRSKSARGMLPQRDAESAPDNSSLPGDDASSRGASSHRSSTVMDYMDDDEEVSMEEDSSDRRSSLGSSSALRTSTMTNDERLSNSRRGSIVDADMESRSTVSPAAEEADMNGDGFDGPSVLLPSAGSLATGARVRATREQVQLLEKTYQENKMPSREVRLDLAKRLQMTHHRVQIWFQNRRAKEKRQLLAAQAAQNTYATSSMHEMPANSPPNMMVPMQYGMDAFLPPNAPAFARHTSLASAPSPASPLSHSPGALHSAHLQMRRSSLPVVPQTPAEISQMSSLLPLAYLTSRGPFSAVGLPPSYLGYPSSDLHFASAGGSAPNTWNHSPLLSPPSSSTSGVPTPNPSSQTPSNSNIPSLASAAALGSSSTTPPLWTLKPLW